MIEIRDYQNTVINKAIHHFIDNDKTILNMCCGSGKTITSLLIAKKIAFLINSSVFDFLPIFILYSC